MNKFLTTVRNMSIKDWVQAIMWIITLILLFAFVIVAGLKNDKVHANAITAFLFTIQLSASILTTVFIKFFEKRKVGK